MRASTSSSSSTFIPKCYSFFFFLSILFALRSSSVDCSKYHHHPAPMDLARFAVDKHNKKQNSLLEFARAMRTQEQIVAGTLHHLTLEAIEAGEKKLYEAKVWVKP